MISLYFDPGLGAMIVQAIVAAVAGVLVFSKNALYKVKLLLGVTKKKRMDIDDIEVKESNSKRE